MRVAERRAPQEVDLLAMRDAAQVVDDANDLFARQAEFGGMTHKDGFVLEHQRYGYRDLEASGAEQLEKPERGSPPRSESGDKHATVENDPHQYMVSHVILRLRISGRRNDRGSPVGGHDTTGAGRVQRLVRRPCAAAFGFGSRR